MYFTDNAIDGFLVTGAALNLLEQAGVFQGQRKLSKCLLQQIFFVILPGADAASAAQNQRSQALAAQVNRQLDGVFIVLGMEGACSSLYRALLVRAGSGRFSIPSAKDGFQAAQ